MTNTRRVLVAVVLTVLLTPATSRAQDPRIAPLAGTFAMQGQVRETIQSEPVAVTGRWEAELIQDGYFLLAKLTTEFPDRTEEAVGIFGYDEAQRLFVISYVTPRYDGISYLTGTYDNDSSTFTWNGMIAVEGLGASYFKVPIEIIDDDSFTMRWILISNEGDESVLDQTTYTRVPPDAQE